MAIAKPAGSWTYEDLSSVPDDGRRYEIVEGELHEMPAPTFKTPLLMFSSNSPGAMHGD